MKKSLPTTNIKQAAPTPGNFLLSLIIPCYNESSRIEIMLQGLSEFDDKWQGNYEVIVVDDGSKDDTAVKVQQAVDSKYGNLKDKIHIERMPANGGKGSALKKGVSLAKGDYILTLDADMSTRPVELINWLKKEKNLFSGDEIIFIGSRKHEDGKVEALASRRLIGGVFNGIVQVFTSLQLKDTQCGFKLYPRQVAEFLFVNMQSKGWAHDVELLYQADLNDIQIREMPINWVNQPESKVNVIKDSMLMLIGVLSISMRIWFYNSFLLPFRIPSTATPEQRKHIIFRSLFNILAVLLVIVMPLMSFRYGITGDEHWHYKYGNSIFDYFFKGDLSAQQGILPGENPPGQPTGIQYYGGIFDFLCTALSRLTGMNHYAAMHFFNAFVGAIGIIYAGKIAKLLGGWSAAILTILLLVLSPSWFGHNFANPKDIPFSVGYTAGIYFIFLFLKALPRPNAKHVFGLICSIGWAMGVRIGGLLLIAYLVLFIGVYAVLTKQLKNVLTLKIVKQIFFVSLGGYLIAILFWPYAQQGIIEKPLEALKVMSNFFVNIGLLYDGKKIFSNQVPWYYIPRYILYTAPIIVLAGFAISFIGIPALSKNRKHLLLLSGLLLFTIVFPLAYAIHKKSSLYDGWRHFLFIYPPLVIMASLGFTALVDARMKAVRYASIALIGAGCLLPLRFMILWHPFESLYYNEIAGGLKNIYGKYETDYYMLGITPAMDWLVKNEHVDTRDVVIGTNCINPVQAYMKRYGKDINCAYVKSSSLYSRDWDYCVLFSRDADASQLTSGNWPPPETIHVVSVDGVPIAAVLKRRTHLDSKGFELLKAKQPEEAKAAFLASLQVFPENVYVWEVLTEIYGAEENVDSAFYAGNKTLSMYPGDINIYEMLGNMYLKMHKNDSAMNLYKRLAQYNPGYSHFFQAYTYATMGDANSAFNELDAAIEADPTNQQPYKLGMQIARQTRNNAKAEAYMELYKKEFEQPDDKEE